MTTRFPSNHRPSIHRPSNHRPSNHVPDVPAEAAIELVERWLGTARAEPADRATDQLGRLVADSSALEFTAGFIDRVARAHTDRQAADALAGLVESHGVPRFLGPIDRAAVRLGATIAPIAPRALMPIARRRLRGMVKHLITDATPDRLGPALADPRAGGDRVNVNLLGEAVLGEAEALRRRDAIVDLVGRPDVDYVSVKVSAIASQLDPWAFEHTLDRVVDRLRPILEAAAASATFVNLDMEEYRDLDLTIAAFTRLLEEPALADIEAGIVLQAYLPDAHPALMSLCEWARTRFDRTGGRIKVRLVKGANLAMERVEAELHDWPQAPYTSKADTDANYRRCLDWLIRPDRLVGVRLGVASHNLFDIAWALLLAEARGVDRSGDRPAVEFEMLRGMAVRERRAVRPDTGPVRLYTPVVAPADFEAAISYLVRRLDENAAPENFLRHLAELEPGSVVFAEQARRFAEGVARRHEVAVGARRTRSRRAEVTASDPSAPFRNEPDTDPVVPTQRLWVRSQLARGLTPARAPWVTTEAGIDDVVTRVRAAQPAWAARSAAERRAVLDAVADRLAAGRGELLATMAAEAGKTPAEADPEISEAIDFARYYARRGMELDGTHPDGLHGARFRPLGVVAVVPPWNFPVAIPAGGVLAALAAGNGVILKPAPETHACGELVARYLWEAGVPKDLFAFVRCPDNEVGRRLVTHPQVDAVILTGAKATADLFRTWKPDLRLFAETSGKNAMVITPAADLDLAVADLVRSAFGHAGQKCSAVSLGILVGEVAGSTVFRRQLVDAVQSIVVGEGDEPGVRMGPLIRPAEGPLHDALTNLAPGEQWLVTPRRLDGLGRLWTPGVKVGVAPGSAFHHTEYFGPVLGLMAAATLEEAIDLQNATAFGLTGGLHSLDESEIARWLRRVEVGNAYINRHTTGAIVNRQPFGGWKASVVGTGAKAGGPNHLLSLGRFEPTTPAGEVADPARWLAEALADDERWWAEEYGVTHDPTGLAGEANVLRYLPRPHVVVRISADAVPVEVDRVLAAARRAGVRPTVAADPGFTAMVPPGTRVVSDADFVAGLTHQRGARVRLVGTAPEGLWPAAVAAEVSVVAEPVTASGRVELLWYLREQAVSRTMHRFGRLLDCPALPVEDRERRRRCG